MIGQRRARNRVAAGAAVLAAALLFAGCGSTAPSGPSPVEPPPQQYPSLAGNWIEFDSNLVIQYRDSSTPLRYNCDARVAVSQTGGTFSMTGPLQGLSAEGDRQCGYGIAFTVDMLPDGTITSVRAERPFEGFDCTLVEEARFSGTASSTRITIVMTDRASCIDPIDPLRRRLKDTDRTLTISVRPQSMSVWEE